MITGGLEQWMEKWREAKDEQQLCERKHRHQQIRKQLYAVVHDGEGNFLMAEKNKVAYFFHEDTETGNISGSIYPKGRSQLDRGGGKPAFPGGAIVLGKDTDQYESSILEGLLIDGAVKEFFEETNALLHDTKKDQGYKLNPPIFPGYYRGKLEYFGVYFEVDKKFLEHLFNTIKLNLSQGFEAAQAVKQEKFKGTYKQLRTDYKGCPLDNELYEIELWNLIDKWSTIKGWVKPEEGLDWYFHILSNLKTHLGI